MKEKLEQIKAYAKEKIEDLKDVQALNDLKVKILGKKGELTEILRGMGALSPEERPVIGSLVNTIRNYNYTTEIQAKTLYDLSLVKRLTQREWV